MDAKLTWLPLSGLAPHPRNPRLALREEVVAGIAASLQAAGAMAPEHALRVRPLGGDLYQVVAGHHRREAAARAGLQEVPCWVREMGDEEAYMALVLDNRQGELSPLEIGLHALEVVGKGKPGRGKKGGLAGYAREVGRSQSYLIQLVQAAEVAKSITQAIDLSILSGSAKHLCAFHALPRSFWPEMAAWLLAGEDGKARTVEDAEKAVAAGRYYLKEPAVSDWPGFLPVEACALACATGAYTRKDFTRLAQAAEKAREGVEAETRRLRALAAERGSAVAVPDLAAEWAAWLEAGAGRESWDLPALRRRRDELEDRLAELRESLETLDERYALFCADLADAPVADASVDCVITDPPYRQEDLAVYEVLARFALRALRPGGSLLVMTGQLHLPAVLRSLQAAGDGLRYHWAVAYLTPGGQSPQIWPRKVNTFWKPVLWLVKGDYAGAWVGDVSRSDTNDNDKRFHDWGQSESGMADLVDRFTSPGQTVCDPFLGGGTTGVVALRLGRRFIGLDIDEKAVETARERIASAAKEDAA